MCITCPNCYQDAYVDEYYWRKGEKLKGSGLTRPCTYCFYASRIPA